MIVEESSLHIPDYIVAGGSKYLTLAPDETLNALTIDQILALYLIDIADLIKQAPQQTESFISTSSNFDQPVRNNY